MKEKVYCIKVFSPKTEKMGEFDDEVYYIEKIHDFDWDEVTCGWSRNKEIAEKFAKYLCGFHKKGYKFPQEILDDFEFELMYTNRYFDHVHDPFYVDELYDDTALYCDPIEVAYPWFVEGLRNDRFN